MDAPELWLGEETITRVVGYLLSGNQGGHLGLGAPQMAIATAVARVNAAATRAVAATKARENGYAVARSPELTPSERPSSGRRFGPKTIRAIVKTMTI